MCPSFKIIRTLWGSAMIFLGFPRRDPDLQRSHNSSSHNSSAAGSVSGLNSCHVPREFMLLITLILGTIWDISPSYSTWLARLTKLNVAKLFVKTAVVP